LGTNDDGHGASKLSSPAPRIFYKDKLLKGNLHSLIQP
jgi:hypothetical protein